MKSIIQIIKEEVEDYRGEHTAPTAEDSPMYDVTNAYGEDMYTSNALRYFGNHNPYDAYSIALIQRVRNKPNAQVKIYRAVPDVNYETTQKLKPLLDIVNYYNKFKFFPLKNQIVYDLEDKYPIDKYPYDKQQEMVLKDIQQQIENLKAGKGKQLTINNGDWVTINPAYAKEHGRDNLNNKYKVITKTVPAKTLFTDGNDIHEWGYVESGIKESLADKFAEREFGFTDPNKEMNRQANSAVMPKKSKSMGEFAGTIGGDMKVYKNPRSLNNFEADVRAISTIDGDLYVATVDGAFTHRNMSTAVNWENRKLGKPEIPDAYDAFRAIQWYRYKSTNMFVFSTSFTQINHMTGKMLDDAIRQAEIKNPTLKFYAKEYYAVEDELDPAHHSHPNQPNRHMYIDKLDYNPEDAEEVIHHWDYQYGHYDSEKDKEYMPDDEELPSNAHLFREMVDDEINKLGGDIIKSPQEIANSLTTDPRFKKGTVLVNLDVKLADEAFKRDEGFYIGKDDRGIANRKEKVMNFIKSGELKYAPEASIYLTADGKPRLSFGDGRHRFAVLRDLGVETINISIWNGSKKLIPLLQK